MMVNVYSEKQSVVWPLRISGKGRKAGGFEPLCQNHWFVVILTLLYWTTWASLIPQNTILRWKISSLLI